MLCQASDHSALVQEREDLEGKVFDLLEEQRDALDPATTFGLLASHGHAAGALKFAGLVEDSSAKFERICSYHAAAKDWHSVLVTLDQAPFDKVTGGAVLSSPSLLLFFDREESTCAEKQRGGLQFA